MKSPPRKKRKTAPPIGKKSKGKGKKEAAEAEWEQAAPGRYFVETKHEKGKRWPDHAFDEVLITEELDGIPGCFRRVEEITMEVVCAEHEEVKWVCEFWVKKE